MGNINMPPGGPLDKTKIQFKPYCQKFKDDPLTITVTDDGEFLCLPLGDFKPNLPEGYVTQSPNPLGPFTPTRNNKDVVMVYVDNKTKIVYVTSIEIRDECKS